MEVSRGQEFLSEIGQQVPRRVAVRSSDDQHAVNLPLKGVGFHEDLSKRSVVEVVPQVGAQNSRDSGCPERGGRAGQLGRVRHEGGGG